MKENWFCLLGVGLFVCLLHSVLSYECSSANFSTVHPTAVSSSVGLLLSSGCLKFTYMEYYFSKSIW